MPDGTRHRIVPEVELNRLTKVEASFGEESLTTQIRAFRARRRLNQERFAENLNISQSTLSRIERGEILPDDVLLTKIKEAMNSVAR